MRVWFFLLLLLVPSISFGLVQSLVTPSTYPLSSNIPVTVFIKTENTDVSSVDNVTVGLDLSYPFVKVSGENYDQKIGTLAGSSSDTRGFRVVTSDDIPEGVYNLRAYYCSGSCSTRIYKDIGVQFNGSVNIELSSFVVTSNLTAGGKGYLVLNVTNFGTGKARSMELEVLNPTTENVLFFVDKPSRFFVGDLNSSQSKIVNISFNVNDVATSGVKEFTVNAYYGSSSKESLGVINIPIKSQAKLRIATISADPLVPFKDESFNLIATLANTGEGKAKAVSVFLSGDGSEDVNSYIGSIDANDDDTVLLSTSSTTGLFNLTVTYEDDFGVHTIVQPVSISLGVKPVSLPFSVILGLLVVVAVGFWWRRPLFKILKARMKK